MAFTITKILLVALYVATWAHGLPTMAGEVSSCGMEDYTNTTSRNLDCSGISSDAIAEYNADSNDYTNPSRVEICYPGEPCCGTIESCSQVGRCFDEDRCSGPSGCDVPGGSASFTSSFTCAPTQTCATSLMAAGATAKVPTVACFDVRARIADADAPSFASVTQMPQLHDSPGIEYTDFAPDWASDTDLTLLRTVTQTLDDVDDWPPESTTDETFFSAESAPFATDAPQLSSSAEPTAQTATVMSISQVTASPAPPTWMTSVQTSAQETPTSINSKPSTPGTSGPSRTSIIVGGLFGTVAFVAISIASVDYLIKQRRYNRCRHSISDTTCSTADDTNLVHKEKGEQQQQQVAAYGYYGTNRAGTMSKGLRVLEANAEPVELPAGNVAELRE